MDVPAPHAQCARPSPGDSDPGGSGRGRSGRGGAAWRSCPERGGLGRAGAAWRSCPERGGPGRAGAAWRSCPELDGAPYRSGTLQRPAVSAMPQPTGLVSLGSLRAAGSGLACSFFFEGKRRDSCRCCAPAATCRLSYLKGCTSHPAPTHGDRDCCRLEALDLPFPSERANASGRSRHSGRPRKQVFFCDKLQRTAVACLKQKQ